MPERPALLRYITHKRRYIKFSIHYILHLHYIIMFEA